MCRDVYITFSYSVEGFTTFGKSDYQVTLKIVTVTNKSSEKHISSFE